MILKERTAKMDKLTEVSRGLHILGNYSQYVKFLAGMMIAGPEYGNPISAEEQKMLQAAGWKFIPFYNRWCYIC